MLQLQQAYRHRCDRIGASACWENDLALQRPPEALQFLTWIGISQASTWSLFAAQLSENTRLNLALL